MKHFIFQLRSRIARPERKHNIDWALLAKKFPKYRDEIYRKRFDQEKLRALKARLEKK